MPPAHAGDNGEKQHGIGAAFRERWREIVASIYIYNEHRGYTSLDRVLAAVRHHFPDDAGFIAAIERHRADERKHYLMFRRWFERQGRMPIRTGRACGHIDRFIHYAFGCTIDELQTDAVLADPAAFEKLCRVIVLTEQRGLVQVEELLRKRGVLEDPGLRHIFAVIHRDEPSHFEPYRQWLRQVGRDRYPWNERAADWCIHKVLLLVMLPSLFFDPAAPRMERWPDEEDQEQPPVSA